MTSQELLETIRRAIWEWSTVYVHASGHMVNLAYRDKLADSIAFELGILEDIKRQQVSPLPSGSASHPDSHRGGEDEEKNGE